VKHWQELGQVLDRALLLARSGRSSALAIVTHIEGSAYRRPGARLLVEEDGAAVGGVSGGCLEEDVRAIGRQVIRTGLSCVRRYETGGDDTRVWGLGLGCEGAVDIVVQPVTPEIALGAWAQARTLLDGDTPFALSSVVEEGGGGGVALHVEAGRQAGALGDPAADAALDAAAVAALRARRSRVHAAGPRTVFTEVLVPPPTLLVCGAGDDARPLASTAWTTGLRVVVADHRAAYLTAERFPQARQLVHGRAEDALPGLPAGPHTYAVVMTHSLRRDTEWVRRLAGADVPYLGVLGPRARTERIVAELGLRASDRIFGPVGLDLGAEGPEQVALSIVAEVLAVRAGREPRHLRARAEAVHA
jgi:xanthine/CO dehydrogenase XdhC/CoxF family maturation factor